VFHTRYTCCVKRAYRYRFYPTPQQASELNRTLGCVRFVWNWALAERTKRYRVGGESVGYHQLSAELTVLKRTEHAGFLSEVASCPLQQCLRHQQSAFGNFFAKRARYPRFKNRHGHQSMEYTNKAFTFRDGVLRVAKLAEPLAVVWSRPLPDGCAPSTVTVSRDTAGRWHVSMLVDEHIEALPPVGTAVGIDLGLKDFVVTSDGERIPHPQILRRKEQRLARYQRMMARKTKGSKNRGKAKTRVAKAYARVADTRRDFLHKTSTSMVRRYDLIVVEDLAVRNMVRNHHLAKSISDSGWGEFRRQLEYKSAWYGRTLVVVDRFFPSSKLCSHCGHLLSKLSLGTRHWTCPTCGTLHDRDLNAAKNILAEGHSVTACGADVRRTGATRARSARKQETHGGDPGNPRP
jgi:putative transposase